MGIKKPVALKYVIALKKMAWIQGDVIKIQ